MRVLLALVALALGAVMHASASSGSCSATADGKCSKPLNLLILGGSGGVGKELVKQATARGHHVTAIVRSASSAAFPASVRVVKGNASDSAVLEAALAGQDAVLSGLGHAMVNLFPWTHPTEVYMEAFHRQLVKSMNKAGVKRFSWVSAAAVGSTWDHVALPVKTFFTITGLRNVWPLMTLAENVILNSNLDYQINHPVVLTDDPLVPGGKKASIAAEAPFDFIPRAQVAEFMLDEIEKPVFTQKYPIILSGKQ